METNKATEATQTTRTYHSPCPQCEVNRVSTEIHEQEYVYGTGESTVRLKVKIPVHTCNQCELQFTDWEAEEIKHNALCEHFGVLNPTQIRQLRKKHDMSRSAFAQLTGLGEASLNRWEKGINIQNIAHDRFLRLLDDTTILNQLRQAVSYIEARRQGIPDNIIPFPNINDRTKLETEQSGFKLRAAI